MFHVAGGVVSETAEVGKARRNLLVITSLLFIIEVTGATINSINAPAITIDIKRPEFIIYFLYCTLAYSMFRFWQIAKPTHRTHDKASNQFLNRHAFIAKLANASIDSNNKESLSISDNNPSITIGVFTRHLIVTVIDGSGRGIQKEPIRVPYLRLLVPELVADIKAIPTHKDFVEYTFPFLYANFVLVLKVVLLLRALL